MRTIARFSTLRLFLLFLLLLAGLILFQAADAPDVVASSPPFKSNDEVSWVIIADGLRPSGEPDVNWHIRFWRAGAPAGPRILGWYHEEIIPLRCKVDGGVSFDAAQDYVFHGNGYIVCRRPRLDTTVFTITNGIVRLRSTQSKWANVEITAQNITGGGQNPLVSLTGTGLYYSSPGNLTVHQMKLEVQGNVTESDMFPVPPLTLPYTMYSDIDLQRMSSRKQASPDKYDEHELDNTYLPSSLVLLSPFCMICSVEEEDFYIGFDPRTNEHLQGTLRYALIDPACKGPGGG